MLPSSSEVPVGNLTLGWAGNFWDSTDTVIVSVQCEPPRPSLLYVSLGVFWGHPKKSLSCWVLSVRQRASWVITAKCRLSDLKEKKIKETISKTSEW